MKIKACSTVVFLSFSVFLAPCANAQDLNNIFDSITAVTKWFEKLNAQFDVAVKTESRAQLQRAIDRLRKNLYSVEIDAKMLADEIPDQRPSESERMRLDELSEELQGRVQELAASAKKVGADLRLNDSSEVERVLFSGIQTRSLAIKELRKSLLPDPGSAWNGPLLRERMIKGVDAIHAAQIAVTNFSNRLSASE